MKHFKQLVRPIRGALLVFLILSAIAATPSVSDEPADSRLYIFPKLVYSQVRILGPAENGGYWTSVLYKENRNSPIQKLKLTRFGPAGQVDAESTIELKGRATSEVIPLLKDGILSKVAVSQIPPDSWHMQDVPESFIQIIEIGPRAEITSVKSLSLPGMIVKIEPYGRELFVFSMDTVAKAMRVSRIADNGAILWERNIFQSHIDRFNPLNNIFIVDERGHVFLAMGAVFQDEPACHLIELDSNGRLLWERSYAGWRMALTRHAAKMTDGGYLLAGHALIRIDSQGRKLWVKTLDEMGQDIESDMDIIALIPDDGGQSLLVVSVSEDHHPKNDKLFFVKLDRDGNISVKKSHEPLNVSRVVPTSDRGLLLAGSTGAHELMLTGADMAAWMMKLDKNLETLWETELQIGGYMTATDISGIGQDCLIAGTFGQGLNGTRTAWLVKLNEQGELDDPAYARSRINHTPQLMLNSLREIWAGFLFLILGP